jgi:prepilin-type processing-associated H-X9-DG protein
MRQIGLGVLNYEYAKKHYPSVYLCDKDGKPLFGWLVQILSDMEYGSIYTQLKTDESWDSPFNRKILAQCQIYEFQCPCGNHGENACTTNYVPIIGPGTIWRSEGTKSVSDLQTDEKMNTVVAVEMANSDKHWAEPFALTVDELLENMKTRKGVRISSYHSGGVHVLFADGNVRQYPREMPLSLWQTVLAGKGSDFGNIDAQIDSNAPDMYDAYLGPPGPNKWAIIVWLFSLVLLFRRAIKSRKISYIAKSQTNNELPTT